LTGGCCSEVDLVLKLFGRDLGWSLLAGGCYSEVVVSSGLTVHRLQSTILFLKIKTNLSQGCHLQKIQKANFAVSIKVLKNEKRPNKSQINAK